MSYGDYLDMIECPLCHGTGLAPADSDEEDCPLCHGHGYVERDSN